MVRRISIARGEITLGCTVCGEHWTKRFGETPEERRAHLRLVVSD